MGADRSLKRLALLTVSSYLEVGAPPANAPQLLPDTPLRDALSCMLDTGSDEAGVVDVAGRTLGRVTLNAIRKAASRTTF